MIPQQFESQILSPPCCIQYVESVSWQMSVCCTSSLVLLFVLSKVLGFPGPLFELHGSFIHCIPSQAWASHCKHL